MINIMNKKITKRVAIAKGNIFLSQEAFELVRNKKLPKGDALAISEVAGILAAKNTASNIPLCHPLSLDFVQMKHVFNEDDFSITLYSIVGSTSKTGVEMEALSAVSIGLLTIYDLCKMIYKNLKISDIELIFKYGGKSGTFITESKFPSFLNEFKPASDSVDLSDIDVAVITLSDRAFRGFYEDKSGVFIKNIMLQNNAKLCHYSIIPDESEKLEQLIVSLTEKNKPLLILTTGGTGLSSRDITPDSLKKIANKEIPGIGEMLRQHGSQYTKMSWISRVSAFKVNQSLVVCLPGSTKAVKESLEILLPLVPHMIAILTDKPHD